jgi:hypothetical protein
MNISELSQLISSVGGVLSPIVVVMLMRQNKKLAEQTVKIEEVHKSTNGLAARNEAIAKKLGVAEGTAVGLAEGRAENNGAING